MPIRRATKDKENPYIMVSNRAIRDVNLSAKAKGILVYLLSMPDDWNIYESELVNHFKDGIDSIRAGIKELTITGYIVRVRERNEKGQLQGIQYEVLETSAIGKTPISENPIQVKPIQDNRTLLSNDNILNNNLTNNKKKNKDTLSKIQLAEFVELTQTEHQKLIDEYGEAFTKACIEKLDNYKGASGKKYKSDYRAILTWVVEDVSKKIPPKKYIPKNPPSKPKIEIIEMDM